MKRSKLKNKFSKERIVEDWSNYKQQQNYYSNLLKESKTRHFNYLNIKDVTENQRFWKTIKPFFTDKTKNSNNILTENYQTIREDEKICKIFNTFLPMPPKASRFDKQIKPYRLKMKKVVG